MKAGLVSATASGSNTPVHSGSGSHEVATEEKVVDEKTFELDALDAKRRYAKKVLGVKIKLTASDIVKCVLSSVWLSVETDEIEFLDKDPS